MYTFIEDNRDAELYLNLRRQVGWVELTKQQAQKALDGSLKIVTVYEEAVPVGMGRIVGDGAVVCYIQDLIVIPEFQSRHIGSLLIDRLIAYVKSITVTGNQMMLCLMCAKGREAFYEKHGFIQRPTGQLGPGMIQYIRIDEK
jgi:GNAT superfamily N-acetyltransferase